MEWTLELSTRFQNALKKLKKHHRNECLNALNNLDSYTKSLESGTKPMQLPKLLSFVHNEREGVHALDQSGDLSTNTEIRLYVFPDEVASELHVILIGDKGSQPRDVNEVHDFVRGIKKKREGTKS